VVARVIRGARDRKAHAIGDTSFTSALVGELDRRRVVVEAVELRLRKRLREQNRRSAEAAADVGDFGAPLELLFDALERRDPGSDQVADVTGAEKTLGAFEQTVVVLTPLGAAALAEVLCD